MLKGWKKINIEDIEMLRKMNENIEVIEYFNSIICQMYSRMMYKIIDKELVICKGSTIMGNYSMVKYGNMNNSDEVKNKMKENGITLRGYDIKGKKDKFGDEYVYDADECVKMIGKKYKRFRKVISRYGEKIRYKTGYNEDIESLILKYPDHQKKFYRFIKNYMEMVKITRIYYDSELLGFSIVENINKKNGVIIQELINHDCKIHDASYLIHYYNCKNNKGKYLNAGGVRRKGIKFAKNKLRPIRLLTIRRVVSNKRLTKEEWNIMRENLKC